MACASGSRKRRYNRFPVAKCMALRKEKWDSILKETRVIQVADEELTQKKKALFETPANEKNRRKSKLFTYSVRIKLIFI